VTFLPKLSPVRFHLHCCAVAFALWLAASTASAQTSRDPVLELTATTGATPPHITLNWNTGSNVTAQKFWRRVKGSASWDAPITLGNGDTTYADSTALPGVAYEYSFQRTRSTAPTTAYGSIVAGRQLSLTDQRGKVILLVDSTMAVPLAPELTLLERNLAGDGWTIFRHDVARSAVSPASTNTADYAPRLAEVQAVRAIVQADYNTAPGTDWALLIVGRVPVPYSGQIAPDGHGDHIGSWPTDSYYGDIDGTWTDTIVNNSATTLSDQRSRNVPGDGKFDHSSLPSNVEIETGRVDFLNMTSAPAGFNETTLLRQYLSRNHQFRRGLGAYANVQRRAIIDDGFGYFGGEAFAASGYRNAIGFFGRSSGQVDALDWFGNLGTLPVLFAYGCGGGSFTSASGIGTTAFEFSRKDSKAVFCALFGSYFGDWDATNNFLRAPLGGTQDSLGLANVWSGRGYFHLYHMALGETIGYGVRYTVNNSESITTGGWSQNGYIRSIHYGLVGDPTLRLHTVRPPENVSAASSAGGVALTWQASPDASLGYHVYRGTSASGPFTRLTGGPATSADPAGSPLSIATLSTNDATAIPGTDYHYLVKAVKTETSASGTYVNSSTGEWIQIVHQGPTPVALAPTGLTVNGTATTTYSLAWQDKATDETSYEVERRNPTSGVWTQIASLAAGSTSYVDAAATTGQINHYRVRAVNASGPSPYTPPTAQYNLPGIADVKTDFFQIEPSVGSLAIPIRRFSGSHGNVSVNYTTTAVLGTAGVDFATPSGSATWTHGTVGDFPANVPIPATVSPQLTKIFRLNIASPAGGMALSNGATTWVQIGDPAAQTLPSPWTSIAIGTTNPGYSEFVGGTFGATVRSGDIGGIADSFRFTHRTVSGDCRITARVTYLSPMTSGLRAGVMIRETTSNASMMNSILINGTTARRIYRTTQGGSADNALTQASVPVNSWLRATRTGNSITPEYSTNGTTWTALGTGIALTTPGAPMLAGLAVSSNNTGNPDVRGYARFDNVELLATPVVPANLTAAQTAQAGQLLLSWSAVADATQYRIERSSTPGSGFAEIAAIAGTSFTDSGLSGSQPYYYRVRGANVAFNSSYTPEASGTPRTPIQAWRLAAFGSDADTGNAADTFDADFDGILNLMEYALGLPPNSPATGALPVVGSYFDGAEKYLTLKFARKVSANDVTLKVDVSGSLGGPWTSLDPLAPANQVSVQNDTPATGWQTLTIKDTEPMSGRPSRFIRLNVSRP